MKLYFNNKIVHLDSNVKFKFSNFDIIRFKYLVGNSYTFNIPISTNSELFEFINVLQSESRLYQYELEFLMTDTPIGDIEMFGIIKNINKNHITLNLIDKGKKLFDYLKNYSLKNIDITSYLADNGTSIVSWDGVSIGNIFHYDYIFYSWIYNGDVDDYTMLDTNQNPYFTTQANVSINNNPTTTPHDRMLLFKTRPSIKIKYLVDEIFNSLGIEYKDLTGRFDNFINERFLTLNNLDYNEKTFANISGLYYRQDVNEILPDINVFDFIKSLVFNISAFMRIENNVLVFYDINHLFDNVVSMRLNNYDKLDKSKLFKEFYNKMYIHYKGIDCKKISTSRCSEVLRKYKNIIYSFNDNLKQTYKPYGESMFSLEYGDMSESPILDMNTDEWQIMATQFVRWECDNVIFKLDEVPYSSRIDKEVYQYINVLSNRTEKILEPIKESEKLSDNVTDEYIELIAQLIDYQNYIEIKMYLRDDEINSLKLPTIINDTGTGNLYYCYELGYSNTNEITLKLIQIKELSTNIEL